LYVFVDNGAPNKWDVLGLLALNVASGPETKGKCGQYSYVRHWSTEGDIGNNAAYLIQNVTVKVIGVSKCSGERVNLDSGSFSEYWGPITENPSTGDHHLPPGKQRPVDMIEFPALAGTCGSVRFNLSASLYMLPHPPPGYTVTGRPPSYDLPHSEQHFSGTANSNKVTLVITISWNCCGNDDETKATRKGK
jgi:hypothetical protein